MCRLLGYLGVERSLADLLSGEPHALEVQSWAPRRQQHGTINADGWGVGWYVEGAPTPARYRTERPMWSDTSFRGMAAQLCTRLAVAEVRSATPPAPSEESGVAPFVDGPYLFAHNGVIDGFPDGVGTDLRRALSARRETGLLGAADSEVLFALALDRLDAGADLAGAVRGAIADVRARTGGRFCVLASDGDRLVGVRAGDTLWLRALGSGTTVASEPTDDDPAWRELADETLVTITVDGIAEEAL
ncbi:MAG: ergothioneine biosynthesis protein EgtC [Acidimicrobiales bacterium]